MRREFIFCDRCEAPISYGVDDAVLDFLQRQYPGRDICPSCDGLIQLAGTLATEDALNGEIPGTVLKRMCHLYGVNIAE